MRVWFFTPSSFLSSIRFQLFFCYSFFGLCSGWGKCQSVDITIGLVVYIYRIKNCRWMDKSMYENIIFVLYTARVSWYTA